MWDPKVQRGPSLTTYHSRFAYDPPYGTNLAISCAIFFSAFVITLAPTLFDLPLTILFNSLAGRSAVLDLLFYTFDSSYTFSGAILMALIWGCWLGNDQPMRTRILAGSIASFAAGIASRRLQHGLPTHLRPFYDQAVHFHHPLYMSHWALNTWYSFPSDHVAVFSGLLTVIWFSGSQFRLPALLWLILVESSRTYEGAHFPSDLLGGAALGCAFVWASQNHAVLRLSRRFMAFEVSAPALFYIGAFFISFQLATLFTDFRNAGSAILQLRHHEASTPGLQSAGSE
ncbi:phosphatase PAP2 family protein [Acidisoma sp.]|uniref:phosphatase PAP2 family protein n=1 Tax=Acidisoma sp. TaxID=1872115 RepID=UPI002D802065|nr:phosphatase PAP2 family protein [Acidisoma sp.]